MPGINRLHPPVIQTASREQDGLASDEASYVTAANFMIDGGRPARCSAAATVDFA
jgi:hypothetical protein